MIRVSHVGRCKPAGKGQKTCAQGESEIDTVNIEEVELVAYLGPRFCEWEATVK